MKYPDGTFLFAPTADQPSPELVPEWLDLQEVKPSDRNPLCGVVDVSVGRTWRLFVRPDSLRGPSGMPGRRRVSGGLINENDDEQFAVLVSLARWAVMATPRRWAFLVSYSGIDEAVTAVAELPTPDDIPRGELFEMDVAYRVHGEPYAPWAEV